MNDPRSFRIADLEVGGSSPLFVIGGPCVIESEELCVTVARSASAACREAGLGFVFKSSFDKANRSSGKSFRGPGLEDGLAILAKIREEFGVPVLTDVHLPDQCARVAEVVDILQIPAFLCRQTDLLEAAGEAAAKHGRAVNVKKGQFLSPWEMKNASDKVAAMGCERVLVTERGASFGYNNLVTDLRSLAILAEHGWPVIFDGTHSAQLPGGGGDVTGGMREMIPVLVRGAVAAGVNGLFLEVHPNPPEAKSDAATQLYLDSLPALLAQVVAIDRARRETAG